MTINALFLAPKGDWPTYEPALKHAFFEAGLPNVTVSPEVRPEEVDYIIYAPSKKTLDFDFTPYARTKAVLSLWAGVEKIVGNATLTMPLARMVDPGMTQSMSEWVTGHVMRYHLGMDADIVNPEHRWTPRSKPLAQERRVCILGLGELGQAAARMLTSIGFSVQGWSRSAKRIDGMETHHGDVGLEAALATAEILVLLLPNTPETTNTLDARRLALLPPGACIINPGRGTLIDDAALIAALDSGQVGHATLDVFRIEPLPADHPFWAHPKVTVTPHIAAETRPITASQVIAENIRRGEAGEPFLYLVDHARGY